MPDLHIETEAGGIVAGVDEVGRGPWAGPVVAAAVIFDAAALPQNLAEAIDDSKRLSARRREDIAQQLPACARIGIGAAATAELDLHLKAQQVCQVALQGKGVGILFRHVAPGPGPHALALGQLFGLAHVQALAHHLAGEGFGIVGVEQGARGPR